MRVSRTREAWPGRLRRPPPAKGALAGLPRWRYAESVPSRAEATAAGALAGGSDRGRRKAPWQDCPDGGMRNPGGDFHVRFTRRRRAHGIRGPFTPRGGSGCHRGGMEGRFYTRAAPGTRIGVAAGASGAPAGGRTASPPGPGRPRSAASLTAGAARGTRAGVAAGAPASPPERVGAAAGARDSLPAGTRPGSPRESVREPGPPRHHERPNPPTAAGSGKSPLRSDPLAERLAGAD